jgi:hypothetical protein
MAFLCVKGGLRRKNTPEKQKKTATKKMPKKTKAKKNTTVLRLVVSPVKEEQRLYASPRERTQKQAKTGTDRAEPSRRGFYRMQNCGAMALVRRAKTRSSDAPYDQGLILKPFSRALTTTCASSLRWFP